jgi:hypothetical protein
MVLPGRPASPTLRLLWKARRHFAVHRYLTQLPKRLLEDYGHGGPYTPRQVESTIGRHRGFSKAFLPYAQALFCDEERLREVWYETGVASQFGAIREELGGVCFGGDGNFSYADVGRYAADHGVAGAFGGHGGEGGGHHGGDVGGHGGGH